MKIRYTVDFSPTKEEHYTYYTNDKEYAIFLCHCINKFYPNYFGVSAWDSEEDKYIYYAEELSKKERNKNEYI